MDYDLFSLELRTCQALEGKQGVVVVVRVQESMLARRPYKLCKWRLGEKEQT